MDTQSSTGPAVLVPQPGQDALRYVLEFVEKSEQSASRRHFIEVADEVLANYMVSFDN